MSEHKEPKMCVDRFLQDSDTIFFPALMLKSAIVDSPKKTRELFFYADETLINPLRNPFKEPLVICPRGEMNSVIVEEDKIKDLMNVNPGVTFWPTNVGGVSPEKPESWVGGEIRKYREHLLNGGVEYADTERGKVKLVTDSPAREIEAPERAVVGYEEPKPIDTIEKKHELRIQALEAEIKNLYRLLNGKADKTIYGTR